MSLREEIARLSKPFNVKYIVNPSQEELRKIALENIKTCLVSAYGNINRVTLRKARMEKFTYIIAEKGEETSYSSKIMTPEDAEKYIKLQKDFIEKQGFLIEIQGYYGIGETAVPVQAFYTLNAANVAGMQQVMMFSREFVEGPEWYKREFKPIFKVVYTPDLVLDDLPGKMAIIVDLENYVTYVMNSDYFGESKKGILRMLNHYLYQKGGLVLHAGAKSVRINGKDYAVAILGLSGTGKTTTTFAKHGEHSMPIQDDMITLWPDGSYTITENGCFAKTFGLTEKTEPVIYKGTIDPSAWVENVYMNPDGTYDFSKEALTPEEVNRYKEVFILTGSDPVHVDAYIKGEVKLEEIVDEYGIPKDGWDFVVWTQNGRSIIPLSAIDNVADLNNLPPLKYIGILNRDEGKDAATPGIVKFATPEQASGYFMLGETSKTSAAGKERGKTRSPFTQPFFPLNHKLQAIRFQELMERNKGIITWMMNTGYVGGDQLDEKSGIALKVKISHSTAMLEALFRDEIKWTVDPDFGYFVVDINAPENKPLIEKVPVEILCPRILYEKQGRLAEYEEWVSRIKKEREEFLRKYGVGDEIVKAVLNIT
ncbi:MAG: phosphoenolpyruvate carboxykinase (ATP) [candidate division WOR-3 bacterium]